MNVIVNISKDSACGWVVPIKSPLTKESTQNLRRPSFMTILTLFNLHDASILLMEEILHWLAGFLLPTVLYVPCMASKGQYP